MAVKTLEYHTYSALYSSLDTLLNLLWLVIDVEQIIQYRVSPLFAFSLRSIWCRNKKCKVYTLHVLVTTNPPKLTSGLLYDPNTSARPLIDVQQTEHRIRYFGSLP